MAELEDWFPLPAVDHSCQSQVQSCSETALVNLLQRTQYLVSQLQLYTVDTQQAGQLRCLLRSIQISKSSTQSHSWGLENML